MLWQGGGGREGRSRELCVFVKLPKIKEKVLRKLPLPEVTGQEPENL